MISLLSIANKYCIPETTLCRHRKDPNLASCCGPTPLLTQKEETAIVEHVRQFNSLGLKIFSTQLKSKAEEMLKIKEVNKIKLGGR